MFLQRKKKKNEENDNIIVNNKSYSSQEFEKLSEEISETKDVKLKKIKENTYKTLLHG